MKTFCPECGFGVDVDDDGCCALCGSTATGSAVDRLLAGISDDPCQCEHPDKIPYMPVVGFRCRKCGKLTD